MGQGRDLNGRQKDGTDIPVEVSLSHYEREGNVFVIAFIVDITGRKKIERSMLEHKAELEKITYKIRQMNADLEIKVEERTNFLKLALHKLERSQRELTEALDKERQLNEIKTRLISMASHEFRTPLTTILSSASLLSKYTNIDEQDKRNKHISKIKNSVNNLNEILEDFLSLGKLNEGKMSAKLEEVSIKEILEQAVEEMKPALKNDQQFVVTFDSDFILLTDKKILQNILFNLIGNAIKFSEEGKTITIKAESSAGKANISVSDEGIGISAEDQEHLFTSFFRAANAVNIEGTGLGLQIVKRYVNLLGGEVELTSEINSGTNITFSIPLSP